MIYYERPNLSVDLPGALQQICSDMTGGPFDHEKMQAVAAALVALRTRSLAVRIWVFAKTAPAFVDRVAEAARHVFEERVTIDVGDVASFLANPGSQYNLYIVSLNDELSRLAIYDRALDRLMEDSFVLLDSFADIVRFDASISRETQCRRLEAKGFDILQQTYYCLASRGFRYFGLATSKPRPVSADVQKRSLFVYGCQRSGTSLLVQILNSRPDVFISYEANWHIEKNRSSLVANFNRMATTMSKPLAKGSFLPPSTDPDLPLAGLFELLQQRYLLVGDKLAFGPRTASYEQPHAHRAMRFLEAEFPLASLILTVREPLTNCLAMQKINRGLPLAFVVDNWLTGMVSTLRTLATNDLSVLCSHEQLCERKIRPIEFVTGLDFPAADDLVDLDSVTSRAPEADALFADAPAEYREILGAASEVYRQLLSAVSDEGRPANREQSSTLQTCHADLSQLNERFRSVAGW